MPLYFPHQGSWQACIFNRLIALQITIYTNWSVEKVMSISHQTSSTTIYTCVIFSLLFQLSCDKAFRPDHGIFHVRRQKAGRRDAKRQKLSRRRRRSCSALQAWSTIPSLFIGSWLPRRPVQRVRLCAWHNHWMHVAGSQLDRDWRKYQNFWAWIIPLSGDM